jgi:hypothetical protein
MRSYYYVRVIQEQDRYIKNRAIKTIQNHFQENFPPLADFRF